ncbi:MAG: S24/S26 family peptidase [Psychrobium sp.]
MFGYQIIKAAGRSMLPAIKHGAYLFVKSAPLYQVNDVVQVEHPYYGPIVKRIIWGDNISGFYLAGDSHASLSVDQMGCIKPIQILGKVRWIINPA